MWILEYKENTCDMDILGLVLINEKVGMDLKYLMIFYPMTLFLQP